MMYSLTAAAYSHRPPGNKRQNETNLTWKRPLDSLEAAAGVATDEWRRVGADALRGGGIAAEPWRVAATTPPPPRREARDGVDGDDNIRELEKIQAGVEISKGKERGRRD